MVVKKVNYQPQTEYLFLDQKRKIKVAERIKKQITKFDLKPNDIGIATT